MRGWLSMDVSLRDLGLIILDAVEKNSESSLANNVSSLNADRLLGKL